MRVEEMVKVARPAHLARLAKLTNLTVAAGALFCAGCGVATGPPVRVTIPPGATLRIATDSLAKAGVVHMPRLFRLYASVRHSDRGIKAGTYLLHR
ncbi:MAG TPA: hypothetical protein VII52_01015, partial [Gemmatimonadaceae bacterium]